MIGFIVGRKVAGQDNLGRRDAEVYNIAVVKNMQGSGCGQNLFDAFAAICSQDDIANVWLEVRRSNVKAIQFYERNGFEAVQTRNHFYDNPREHAILMRLVLK
jgi:ribosomal-protein-alanine N-acetyltransferase